MTAARVHDDITVVVVTLSMAVLVIIMSRSKLMERTAESVLRNRGDEITPESVERTKVRMVRLLICAVGFVISVTNLAHALIGH
jgi:hypothetical protein